MPLPPFIATARRRNPRSIPDLTLWIDCADSTTLFDSTTGGSTPAANAEVARITDKGPSAFSFTQGTLNNRPLRRVANQNGLDGVQFDGSNDSLYAAANVFDTGVAVLLVFKLASSTARCPTADLGNYGASGSFIIEANTFSTVGSRMGLYAGASTGGSTFDSGVATSTSARIAMVAANATGGGDVPTNTAYRIDGVASTLTRRAGADSNYLTGYSTNSGTAIGAYNNNGSGGLLFGGFTLYELCVWSRQLTPAECQWLERYAARKWGIAL